MFVWREMSHMREILFSKLVRDPNAIKSRLAFMAGVYTRRVRTYGRACRSSMLIHTGPRRAFLMIRLRSLEACSNAFILPFELF